MGYYRKGVGALGASFQPTVQTLTIPGSVGGVNSLNSLMSMAPEDCLATYNLMPSERGMELRKGYREWAAEIGGAGTEEEVRTLVTYDGVQADHVGDRIFAMTNTGIYDVTLFNTVDPAPVLLWPVQGGGKAGYGAFTNFANDASEHFVYYADTANGLYQYDASNFTWAAVTGLTVDDGLGVQIPWGLETSVANVQAHKLRLWLTVDDSGDAWYLPVDSGAGEVFKFTFGSKFEHGGYLMGIWSWSYESTAGIQDYLVAISRAGDLLVYKGSDPTQPDWELVGSYFIGEVTNSRNIAVNYGSEMYVLSTYGLTAITDLIKGVEAYQLGPSPSTKIARVLRQAVQAKVDSKDWTLIVNPTEGFLQITTPYEADRPQDAVQFTQNLLTHAWGYWRGIPTVCAATLEGEYFMGTKNGQVLVNDGLVDDARLDGEPGRSIEFETLTAFVHGENPAQYKRVGYIRTIGLLEGEASVQTIPVYDYKIQNSANLPAGVSPSGGSLWDEALWDLDVWNSTIIGADVTIGGLGMGRSVAVSMRGTANARIVVIGWDLMYTRGGYL